MLVKTGKVDIPQYGIIMDLKRFLIDKRTKFLILKVVYKRLAKENTAEHSQF